MGEFAYLADQGDYHWEGGIRIGLEETFRTGKVLMIVWIMVRE